MIIVTGGAYQGKLEFAKGLSEKEEPLTAEGESSDRKALEQADIIAHFHLYIRRLMKEETEPEEQVKKLIRRNPHVILEINELGCGVVPMDAFDRSYREQVGRISCELAKQAEEVYLVNCGIGRRLK